MIQELQVKLTAMEPMLIEEEANAQGDKDIIEREKGEAEQQELIVSKEAGVVELQKNDIAQKTNEVQQLVENANKLVKQAEKEVDCINQGELAELRGLASPIPEVLKVC